MKRSPPSPVRPFADDYRERFAEYHLAWSVFFVAHLSDLRRELGDLEDALLLAAFGLGPVAEKLRAARASGDLATMEYNCVPSGEGATNASRLAELTGIPRQTVRRKLAGFLRRGWIEQTGDGSWRISVGPDGKSPLARDLQQANTQFVLHLARLVSELDRIRGSGADGDGAGSNAPRQ